MISPGVQKPHCTAPQSTNACCTSLGRPDWGDPLDRDDLLTGCRCGQHETTADELIVDHHAARAALALLARALRTDQAEPLTQHIEQALADPGIADLVARR